MSHCFIFVIVPVSSLSSARKRTTSCTIPESVRGSWKEHFAGTEAEIQLKVDIGVTSAKLHIDVENRKSEAEFDCLAEGDGYFLTKESVPSVIKKWSDIRSAAKGKTNNGEGKNSTLSVLTIIKNSNLVTRVLVSQPSSAYNNLNLSTETVNGLERNIR